VGVLLSIRQGNPWFSWPSKFSAGTWTFSSVTQVLSPALKALFLIFRRVIPGKSIGMIKTETPAAPGPPVRTAVVMWVALKPPVIHFCKPNGVNLGSQNENKLRGISSLITLCPLTIYALPSSVFFAVVLRLARSDPPVRPS